MRVDARGREGEDCCDSCGLVVGFSSPDGTLATALGFAGGLVVESVAVVVSTFSLPGCRTAFGGLAEMECLPLPGFDEKKEE